MKKILILTENDKILKSFDNYSIAYRYAVDNLSYSMSYRTFRREFENSNEFMIEEKKFVETELIKK